MTHSYPTRTLFRSLLRRIIGGVDLYRRQTAGGMFQLLRLRELGWIEAALPRLTGPAAATDMNGLGHRRSDEHKSELPPLMRISYAVFCLQNTNQDKPTAHTQLKHHPSSQDHI